LLIFNIADAEAPAREEIRDSTSSVLISVSSVPEKKVQVSVPVNVPVTVQGTFSKDFAQQAVINTWGIDEWDAFDKIIAAESGWTVNGDHPSSSSAFGLGGFLDGTWGGVGCVKTYDVDTQILCTIKYIQQRKGYGTPTKAWEFHKANNWY
jgi:hypothetical protein